MKKLLSLVLAAVMALSLVTIASAAELNPVTPSGADYATPGDFFYGDDPETFYLENTGDGDMSEILQDILDVIDSTEELIDALELIDTEVVYLAAYADMNTAVDAIEAFLDLAFPDDAPHSLTVLSDNWAAGEAELAALIGELGLAVDALDDLADEVRAELSVTGDFVMSATSVASGAPAFRNTGNYSLSVSVSSDNSYLKASYKLVKNSTRDGVAIEIKLTPASERFTVEEITDDNYKVKIRVVQKDKTHPDAIIGELEVKGIITNTRATHADSYSDASGNYLLETDARVIDVSVFEEAEGKALSVRYDDYSVKFAKVAKQNTSLYLYAKTDVVDVDNTKAIGSVGFQPTRVKDAATITMPISYDNQNFYGETVYVYKVVDGKPTGAAIPAEVVNHNSIVFSVPAGTALGTFAAYGAKEEGDAEKPAIPETGANDIVNIAIVFAVVALAAAGFVAVKASK